MAIPPIEYQIHFVDSIILVRAIPDQDKTRYRIEEVLKSRYVPPALHDYINVDLTIFELLGYSIHDHQQVVIFLAEKKDSFDCIEFLPVKDGKVTYGKDDRSVFVELTLPELRKLISLHA